MRLEGSASQHELCEWASSWQSCLYLAFTALLTWDVCFVLIVTYHHAHQQWSFRQDAALMHVMRLPSDFTSHCPPLPPLPAPPAPSCSSRKAVSCACIRFHLGLLSRRGTSSSLYTVCARAIPATAAGTHRSSSFLPWWWEARDLLQLHLWGSWLSSTDMLCVPVPGSGA